MHAARAFHAVLACADARALLQVVSGVDALPDELLSLLLHALPLVRRLRACLVSRRFKRLLYTPALRAAFSRAHMLPAGSALEPGSFITSPDGRFSFVFQNDANVVLYYAGGGHAPGVRGQPVWAMQTVGGIYGYAPDRLEMHADGNLAAYGLDDDHNARWQSGTGGRGAPPYRLVARDCGDVAILDADDAEVWTAVPENRPWLA